MATDLSINETEIDSSGVNLSLCLICQKRKHENLVENPETHDKVRSSIQEWAEYGYLEYAKVWANLKSLSIETLKERKTSWHRSCYKNTVHAGMLKRARQR